MELYYYKGQPTKYSVEKDGRVYSHLTNKYMVGVLNKRGYRRYLLTIQTGHKVSVFAHRMVMETYCPIESSENFQVNHKDNNPDNNHLDNLEWVTPAENIHYACYKDKNTKVYAYNDEKKLVKQWESLAALYKETKFNIGLIGRAFQNRDYKYKINGYYWSNVPLDDFKTINPPNTGKARAIGQYTLDGILIKTYQSRGQAARELGVNGGHITECCQHKIPTYKGYKWEYLNEDIV